MSKLTLMFASFLVIFWKIIQCNVGKCYRRQEVVLEFPMQQYTNRSKTAKAVTGLDSSPAMMEAVGGKLFISSYHSKSASTEAWPAKFDPYL